MICMYNKVCNGPYIDGYWHCPAIPVCDKQYSCKYRGKGIKNSCKVVSTSMSMIVCKHGAWYCKAIESFCRKEKK